jgi:hypothetical protein
MTGRKRNYNLQVPFDSNDLQMIDELQKYYLEEMQITISKTQLMKTALKVLHRQFCPKLHNK